MVHFLQLLWNRISFSRLTLFYFLFSLVHFITQLSFQIKAFTINAEAAGFLNHIVTKAHTTNHSLPILIGSTLRICSWVPSNLNVDIPSCPIVWNGEAALNGTEGNFLDATASNNSMTTPLRISKSSSSASSFSPKASTTSTSATTAATVSGQRTITVFVPPQPTTVVNDSFHVPFTKATGDNNTGNDLHSRSVRIIPDITPDRTSVTLTGLKDNGSVILENRCLWALNWPVSVLNDTVREDIVFMAFQFWVLGMSIVALLNESIPHIIASLVTHMMATAWVAFQLGHADDFASDFNRVITNGACQGVSLLPNYWHTRNQAEIPSLVLNVIALFVSCFLTSKLVKSFGWQTFKRVGASLTIHRIYKLVLTLSITIQLSLFFMAVTVSLWIDQLMNGIIGDLASFQILYKVSSFITLALLIPWLMTGWFAVRHELRVPMLIFLILSVLYLGGWSVMFVSTTFRWTFTTWTFFGVMATASSVLTLLSAILGVVCRVNFGKGLARCLNGDSSDEYADIEKVAFSPHGQPTYAGDIKPTYSPSSSPYDTPTEHWVTFPEPALQRNTTDVQVYRNNSTSGSIESLDNSQTKRWIIE